ncbi:hypothetical protein DRH27_00685 [Candidatus Falkowbacteria bacterium]|nr:MAG: hypothetical protein DRH27_00685 [Candidatus Falkowbacteria bacterium]
MKNLILLGIGSVIVGVTIGGVVYYNKNTNNNITITDPNTVEQGINYNDLDDLPENNNEGGSKIKPGGTLEDLTAGKLGNNISCYSVNKVNDEYLEIMTYISGNKLRADYYLSSESLGWRNAPSSMTHMHIIHDGEYAFIWGKAFLGQMLGGMKYKLNYNDDGTIEEPDSEMTPDMLNYKLPVVDCRPWTLDNSVFGIPEGISFADIDNPENIEELFEETIEGGDIDIDELLEQDPEDPCFGCGFMPDSMKADCYAGCQ